MLAAPSNTHRNLFFRAVVVRREVEPPEGDSVLRAPSSSMGLGIFWKRHKKFVGVAHYVRTQQVSTMGDTEQALTGTKSGAFTLDFSGSRTEP